MVQGERVGSILRRVPIVRPGAVCQGTEAMLAECPLPRVPQDGVGTVNTGIPLCSHGDDVLLTCFNGPSDRAIFRDFVVLSDVTAAPWSCMRVYKQLCKDESAA